LLIGDGQHEMSSRESGVEVKCLVGMLDGPIVLTTEVKDLYYCSVDLQRKGIQLTRPLDSCDLCSAKTPSGYGETLIILWPNSRHSLLKIVVDQEVPVIVSFQPVVEVNLVQIRRYHLLAEFVSFRT
jgi:hypothetical protein